LRALWTAGRSGQSLLLDDVLLDDVLLDDVLLDDVLLGALLLDDESFVVPAFASFVAPSPDELDPAPLLPEA